MGEFTVGFAGLSHLGLVSAAAATAQGVRVVAFDPDTRLTEDLARGELPVDEPGLAECMSEGRSLLTFTSDVTQLKGCQLVYVARDVPTDDAGQSDLTAVRQLVDDVVAVVGGGACVVVLSQVPPGFTRGLQRPGVRLLYQVETLVFGRALERALRPERFIVGVRDSDEPVDDALREYLGRFDCPVLPMRYESAELAKIAINAMLVASISAANTLAELCESIGADWSEITPSLRLDARIGASSYIEPGLGLAGGNLERDLATIIGLADQNGTDAGVVRSWVANSRHRRQWAAEQLRGCLDVLHEPHVGVWGLAYKQNTHSIKNSVGVDLVRSLSGSSVTWFDPVVDGRLLGLPGDPGGTALEAARGVDVLCVMTPWPEFSAVDLLALAEAMRGRIVIDPFGVLDSKQLGKLGLEHRVLGRAPDRVEGGR